MLTRHRDKRRQTGVGRGGGGGVEGFIPEKSSDRTRYFRWEIISLVFHLTTLIMFIFLP